MVEQTDLAAQMFPQAELLMVPAEAFALEALCRGEVDAALVSQISLMMAVVTTAPGVCAGKPLQLTSARRAVFTRTAAAPRFHRAADALIQRFGEVALDGTLDELARGQPGVLPTLVTQAKVVAQESRDRRRQRELIAGLSAIIAALVAMAAYLRTARRRADQAMVQAQAGERAKCDFLAMMSHEIRTPLNGILGMTGLIRDEPDPAVARDYAATAQASAQHLMGLLEGVLDISALEAGAIQLKHRPFDLHELIERAANAVRSSAKPAVAISTVISPAVPRRASGDPERLMQILLSLLSNAEKFTDQGTVVVGAELVSHPAAGPVVRLSVSDTGIGIPVTLQERIFEKFEQGDQSITRRHGGMGLGLAIARALVQAMGGQIQVASTEGVGTTLAVTLQFAHAPEL
jgi:signal transduction histidine kinase